jgi:LysM repeat protein
MKNKPFFVIILIVLFAIGLAACERSASTPPPDEQGNYPLPEETQDVIGSLEEMMTQTAMASSAGTTPEEQATQAPEEQAGEGGAQEEPAPTATPEPPAEPKEYPIPNTYTLQRGEFPYCIARRFNISPSALLAKNSLTRASVTYPGQVLTIPKDAGKFDEGQRSLKAHPAKYTVQAGDTVFTIACVYGDVDPRAIEDANGLKGAYSLNVGDVLQIP